MNDHNFYIMFIIIYFLPVTNDKLLWIYTYTVSTLKPQQYLLVLGFYLYKSTIKVIPIS